MGSLLCMQNINCKPHWLTLYEPVPLKSHINLLFCKLHYGFGGNGLPMLSKQVYFHYLHIIYVGPLGKLADAHFFLLKTTQIWVITIVVVFDKSTVTFQKGWGGCYYNLFGIIPKHSNISKQLKSMRVSVSKELYLRNVSCVHIMLNWGLIYNCRY